MKLGCFALLEKMLTGSSIGEIERLVDNDCINAGLDSGKRPDFKRHGFTNMPTLKNRGSLSFRWN
jgi:hypothetical protein